MLLHMLTVWEN